MRFESPWALLLLAALPAFLYVRQRMGAGAPLRYSAVGLLRASGTSWRLRLAWLPTALRAFSCALFVVVLARPQQGQEEVRVSTEGIAIEMVVDRSGSMGEEIKHGDGWATRLAIVKEVFTDFVEGGVGALAGRPNDLIGMVSFAGYAETVCPLTLGHGALQGFLRTVELAVSPEAQLEQLIGHGKLLARPEVTPERRVKVRWRDAQGRERTVSFALEDGTAIGDAVALAAARLKTAEERFELQAAQGEDAFQIQSKIIILLTDGEHNAGARSPMQAAKLAREWGIRIYAIGFGGEGTRLVQGPTGAYRVPSRSRQPDFRALKAMAEATGGLFREAADSEALRSIYEEIDRLERTEVETVRYLDYQEFFTPFLLGALALLALEVLLSATLFRRVP